MSKMKSMKFIIALVSITFVISFAMLFVIMKPSYASSDSDMLYKAKHAKSDTRYVIVTCHSCHKTKVYDKKKNYKVVASSASAGAKKGRVKYGTFKLTGWKIKDRKGTKKNKKGKSLYHEYFFSAYNNKTQYGIHSLLYKTGPGSKLYNNTKDKIQNAKKPYANNWSNGCTRVSYSLAKYVYDHCGKGTAYVIYK